MKLTNIERMLLDGIDQDNTPIKGGEDTTQGTDQTEQELIGKKRTYSQSGLGESRESLTSSSGNQEKSDRPSSDSKTIGGKSGKKQHVIRLITPEDRIKTKEHLVELGLPDSFLAYRFNPDYFFSYKAIQLTRKQALYETANDFHENLLNPINAEFGRPVVAETLPEKNSFDIFCHCKRCPFRLTYQYELDSD